MDKLEAPEQEHAEELTGPIDLGLLRNREREADRHSSAPKSKEEAWASAQVKRKAPIRGTHLVGSAFAKFLAAEKTPCEQSQCCSLQQERSTDPISASEFLNHSAMSTRALALGNNACPELDILPAEFLVF